MDKQLTDSVIAYAKKNGINQAALLAVVEVESSGTPLWKVGDKMLPPIRFEGHYFYARLKGMQLDRAIKEGLAAKSMGVVKNPRSYKDRYAMVERARKIDDNAALESVSWGAGQVMGANWKSLGYKSVKDLVDASYTVEGQVDMIVRFLKVNNLIDAMNNKDWHTVAKGYNGKNYKKGNYHGKMADAYARHANGGGAQVDDSAIIMQIQTMLNAVGDYKLVVDGDYGKTTKAALVDFQIKKGLVGDGKYGPITQEHLEAAYKAKANDKNDLWSTIGAGAGAAGAAASQAAKEIEPLIAIAPWLQWAFIGLTVIGIALVLKSKLTKR